MSENWIPQRKGLYWAKSGSFKWWNLLVQVMGEPPFLHGVCWDLAENKIKILDVSYVSEWGDHIPSPFDE